jgi:DNA polymerase zeta
MRAWFATMPRPQRLLPQKRPAAALGLGSGRFSAGTIDAYYLSRHCAVSAGSQRPSCLCCHAWPGEGKSFLWAFGRMLSGDMLIAWRRQCTP